MFPPQEVNLLRLLLQDLSQKEIAVKMRLDPRTVATYQHNLLKRLNIKTAGRIETRIGLIIAYYSKDKSVEGIINKALGINI